MRAYAYDLRACDRARACTSARTLVVAPAWWSATHHASLRDAQRAPAGSRRRHTPGHRYRNPNPCTYTTLNRDPSPSTRYATRVYIHAAVWYIGINNETQTPTKEPIMIVLIAIILITVATVAARQIHVAAVVRTAQEDAARDVLGAQIAHTLR